MHFSKTLSYNQGRMQDFSGGESTCPTLKFLGIWIYMPRAAKLRAVAGGGLGACPPRNFFKMVHFVRFEGYFQPLS